MPAIKRILSVTLIACLSGSLNAMEKDNEKTKTLRHLAAAVGRGMRRATFRAGGPKGQPTESPREDKSEANDFLLRAVEQGSIEEVEKALARGAQFEALNEEGNSIFHRAVFRHHVFLRHLLKKFPLGAMKKNREGQTALHIAAITNNLEAVKVLLATGMAKIDGEDVGFNTPLHEAARFGHAEVIYWLIGAGANIRAGRNTEEPASRRPTPLLRVIAHAEDSKSTLYRKDQATRMGIINKLLEENKELLEDVDNEGNSALHIAVLRGEVVLCRKLLKHATPKVLGLLNNDDKTAKQLAETNSLLSAAFDASFTKAEKKIATRKVKSPVPTRRRTNNGAATRGDTPVARGIIPLEGVSGADVGPSFHEDPLDRYKPENYPDFEQPSSSQQPTNDHPAATEPFYARSLGAIKIVTASIFIAIAGKLGYDYFKSSPTPTPAAKAQPKKAAK